MKLQDIRHESATEIIELKEIARVDQEKNVHLNKNEPVRIIVLGSHMQIVSQLNDNKTVSVEPVNPHTKSIMDRLEAVNLPRLITVLSTEKHGIQLCIKTFSERKHLDYSIRLSNEFYEKLKKSVQLSNVSNPKNDVIDNTLYRVNDINFCVVGIHIKAEEKQKFNNFIIVGRDFYLHIKKVQDEDEKIYYVADKVTTTIKINEYKFFLAQGKIKYTEEREVIQEATIAAMEELGTDTYIKIWDAYGEIERQIIMKKANELGSIRFISHETESDGKLRLDIDSASQEKLKMFQKEFSKGDILSILAINPFSRELEADEFENFLFRNNQHLSNLRLAENIKSSENCMYFSFDEEMALKLFNVDSGYIFMSTTGDMKRLNRRANARNSIENATCPMPNLSAVLEGKSVSKPKKRKLPAMSEVVKEEIFTDKNGNYRPPTINQEQAISIALNTPDIALIQGPPGTGKTTVITAILKRLNEECDSTGGIFGRNLVTAFQHDAVQNAIDRIEILGLPAIKFGKKYSENEDDLSEVNVAIESWINEKSLELHSKHSTFLNKKYITDFNNIFMDYMYSANSVEQTINILEKTRSLLLTQLSKELLDNINDQIRELKYMSMGNTDPELKSVIRAIRRIPTNKIAFEDDGRMIIREAIYKLRRLNDSGFADYIKNLEYMFNIGSYDFEKLKSDRKEILVILLPKENIFTTHTKKEEITILMTRISEYLLEQIAGGKNGEELVILQYLQTLEENPLAVKNSILNYTAVNGATNQQVMRKEISDLKGGEIVYDNVLVDEAARSNPLDLFIPMSIAKDRIILVGDHRQLPHIIDENIVKALENGKSVDLEKEVEEKIRESMFEQLFTKLKKLEAVDGIKRTITLDKQYRMHRVLGEFINDNFYEKYGENEKVESPRKDEEFSHSLPELENKACVWYDVSISEGKETNGQSKSRRVEAKKIAEHLKKMLLSKAGQEMNFGIITFYKDQVSTICDELYIAGVYVKDEDGNFDVAPEFRGSVLNKVEKIKIGTVDAFQGMEFDVVYLSMVRSNTYPGKTQLERQKKYGFLMYENRLCVSMSRQKKMLICVGDSTMLEGIDAEEAINPLVEYYRLCKGDLIYGKVI